MSRPNSSGTTVYNDTIDPLIQLWLLRILVPLEAHKKVFSRRYGYCVGLADDSFEYLMDNFNVDPNDYKTVDEEIDHQKGLKCLHKLYESAEKKFNITTVPECLSSNVQCLSTLAGLSATDCRILEFAVLIHTEYILERVCTMLGDLSSIKVFKVLSAVLGLPQPDIQKSLSKKSILSKSGLLTLNQDRVDELKDKLELLSPDFAENMVSSDADPVTLLRDAVFPSSPPDLAIDDYPHLTGELDMMRPYLKRSLSAGRRGVNFLLYGEPGTGKTQLAKILAADAGCQLFEVASEDNDGEPITDNRRLRAFQAAQSILSNQNMMILFDEIEDVFDSGYRRSFDRIYGFEKTIRNPKAWVTRRLEENPVPTLWLGNSIDGLDPAFIRRFDMIINMPVPPKRQRQKIIRASCANLLSERDIERISSVETLAPAIVTRATSIVSTIRDELSDTEQAPALELLINNTLEAQGYERIQCHDPNRLPETYDPTFIHTDTDIEGIAAGLKKTKAGRLCLYGPPGTGKTAYVRWLAEQLEVPLLVKRGSDLMSMWVGGTEKNIAGSFRQAEMEGAILLIDEVEGFLQDRREARCSWEVTGVNEMLTRMEGFPGIFIASTNLLDSLDQAALRRFDLKIKFDYLLPRQSQALLESYCQTLNLGSPDKTQAAYLGRLNNLAPGDFAAVVRRHRFKLIYTTAEMVSALDEECSHKENFKRPIGF